MFNFVLPDNYEKCSEHLLRRLIIYNFGIFLKPDIFFY